MRGKSWTRKGCDLIVANDVSPAAGVMGGDENTMVIVDAEGETVWPKLDKEDAARRLVAYLGRILRQSGRGAGWRSGSNGCPMPRGLPLPSYQSAGAAGLDLVAAAACRCAFDLAAGRPRLDPDRPRH